jgi:hypothetical protein
MKKILLLVLFLSYTFLGFSASIPSPDQPLPTLAKEVMIPLMRTDQMISLEDYLRLTPQTYKQITGKKMTLIQKIDLGISKRMVKQAIRKDGTVNLEKMKRTGFFGGWSWHWGGFALGFFLSLLGPIVALFFNDDYKWDRFWTALHTSVWLLVIVVAVAAALGAS